MANIILLTNNRLKNTPCALWRGRVGRSGSFEAISFPISAAELTVSEKSAADKIDMQAEEPHAVPFMRTPSDEVPVRKYHFSTSASRTSIAEPLAKLQGWIRKIHFLVISTSVSLLFMSRKDSVSRLP